MKIFFQHSILFLCALAAIFLFFHQFTRDILMQRHVDSMRELTDRISNQVETLLVSLDKIALQAATNPLISYYFSHDIPWELLSVEEKAELQEMLVSIAVSGSASSVRVSLLNSDGKYVGFGIPVSFFVTNDKKLVARHYNQTLSGMNEENYRLVEFRETDFWDNNRSRKMCTLVRPIFDSTYSYRIGLAEIQMDYSEIARILASTVQKDVAVSISPAEPALNGAENATFGYTYIPEKKPQYIRFYRTLQNFNFTVIVTENIRSFLRPVHRISLLFFCATFLVIVLLCAAIYITSKKLAKPLETVLHTIQSSDINTCNKQPTVKNKDEFDTISITFEKLFESLQQSITEKNSAKTEELKAHFIALQSQIDPHFLYNMLAILSATGREKNVPEITAICKNLTHLLRYISIFNENTVTLTDELAHIESYFQLMKIRFEDQFSYIINADQMTAQQIKLPRLTLQPIVENCFQHAFKRTEPPWKIEITLSTKQDSWSVSVDDNGCGIDDKKKYKIFFIISEFLIDPAQHIDEVRFGGMGLVNCGVRFKMFSSYDSLFSIEKSRLGGSRITIGGAHYDSGIAG